MLSRFVEPFLGLWRHAAGVLLGGGAAGVELEGWTQTMCLLADVYFDFACQDLPPALEDTHEEFWGASVGDGAAGGDGWLLRLMKWDGGALGSSEVRLLFIYLFVCS